MSVTTPSAAVHLRAGGTSVVVQTDAWRLPRILHWGTDLGELSTDELAAMASTAQPWVGDSPVTYPMPVPVLAQLAEGWLGRPGLVGQSLGPEAGRRWAPLFTRCVSRVTRDETRSRLVADAVDAAYGLTLRVEIEVLTASGLVRQRATLKNIGEHDYEVHHLELALPLPPCADEVLDLTGRHTLERRPQRRTLDVGEWARTSRGGKPGLEHTMLVVAGEPGFGFRSGQVWATHLAWSGNQTLAAERVTAGPRRLVAGEELWPGEAVLPPGASHVTPWQYGSWGEGLDAMSARFHRHLRALPGRAQGKRPVTVNTWEAVYFRHDLPTLVALAERAAAVGAERFVLDDGWFTGRRDDTSSLGDWDVDPAIWTDGLGPLVDAVRGLGMQFGLWFEPEMINLDSRLAREHPEWVFDAGHGAGLPSRYQRVLDLGHPEAYAHVLSKISGLVAKHDIDYIKWDHNRYLLDAGHAPTGRAGVRNQVLATYAMIDELRARHPGLEIESCASGGGRIDLGILERTDRVWPSDCMDPHDRLEIQRWTSLMVPPEIQGTHIGAADTHTTHRVHPLSFRAEKALWGHMGVETNLLTMGDAERAEVTAWIAFHKEHRDLLHGGVVVHADLPDSALRLEGVVSTTGDRALYAFSTVERSVTWPPGRLALPGLDPKRRYRVELAGPGGAHGDGDRLPPWTLTGVVLSGRVLTAVGVEMPPQDPDRSIVLAVTAVDNELGARP